LVCVEDDVAVDDAVNAAVFAMVILDCGPVRFDNASSLLSLTMPLKKKLINKIKMKHKINRVQDSLFSYVLATY